MNIENVKFEVRVCQSVKTGRSYMALFAICHYGEYVVSFDRQIIANITNLTSSDIASLQVGDVIKFN